MNNSKKILNYSVEGEGLKLVLIHGFLESNSMWNHLKLEKNFTCIKIELPDHGTTEISNQEETISFMAQCVKDTLDEIGLSEFDIIGHSLGGYVALEFVSLFDLPGKLILLHSNFWQDDEQKKVDRQRVAKIVLTNKNLFLNEAIPALFVNPKKHFTEINNLLSEAKNMKASGIAQTSIAMRDRRDHKEILKKYSSEIFIIQGKLDRLVPHEKMNEMVSGLNNKMVTINDVGHMGQHENPLKIRNTILELIQ